MSNILLFLVIILTLSICYFIWQCFLVYQKTKKLNKICNDLYIEYKKTQSPQWAENVLKDIICRVVSQANKKTTSVYRT